MKLSFTTLGCPDWPLERIIECAAAYGFDAIDFRGLTGEMNIYNLPEFSEGIKNTRQEIIGAGLEVSCFSSSVHLTSRENFAKNLQEVTEYAKLCEFFGTRYIRVFGGKVVDSSRDKAIETVVQHVNEMAKVVKAVGAKLLIETHDDWTACEDIKAVMEQIDQQAVGVLWDVHHPYRMLKEEPEHTWDSIGRWIEYTHVKDSKLKDNNGHDFQYCLTGDGDIPLKQIYEVLLRNGYDGYYTLEWEKKWHPELVGAEIAFPQYVKFMRNLSLEVSV